METGAKFQRFLKGIRAEFAEVYVEGREKYEPFILGNQVKLFKRETTEEYKITDVGVAGTGYLTKTDMDGGEAQMVDRPIGYEQEWIQEMYRKGVAVTYKNWRFNNYKDKLNVFKSLTVSARKTQDKVAFDMFVNAFDATNYAMADGQALVDGAHPFYPGSDETGTQSNALVDGSSNWLALSETNFNTAVQKLMSYKLSDGTIMTSGATNLALVVPPALFQTARVIAESELKPASANNDINVFKGLVDVVVSPYLSAANSGKSYGDSQWFLVDLDVADLRVYVSDDAEKMETQDEDTLTYKSYIHTTLDASPGTWHGVTGSQGTGTMS